MTSSLIPMSKFFEDFAALTMASWQSMTREQLAEEYNVTFEEVSVTARDFAAVSLSDDVVAVRYTWTLANSVELLDIHLFVFDGENCAIERHYRVRAVETL